MLCRFTKDLPPGLDEMNDHLLVAPFPPEVQPVQDIMQILKAAARVAPSESAAYESQRAAGGAQSSSQGPHAGSSPGGMGRAGIPRGAALGYPEERGPLLTQQQQQPAFML